MSTDGKLPVKVQEPKTWSRRDIFKWSIRTFIAALGGWTLLEPLLPVTERKSVKIADLDTAFDGFRFLLLADSHCGPFTGSDFIKKAVNVVNSENPDAVLLLGDFSHQNGKYIKPGIAPFAKLKAKLGVFAVLGNHDHWHGKEQTISALKSANVKLLQNEAVQLKRGEASIILGGVDDLWEGRPNVNRAFGNLPKTIPRILMSHNPDYAEHIHSSIRVDLMLSGHTHGGQVNLPFIGAPILPVTTGQKYRAGFVDGPACKVYISRGLGTVTPPVRFRCRPEITVMTLRPSTAHREV